MKRVFGWLGIAIVSLLLFVTALGLHTWYAKPLSVNWFYTKVFAGFALDNPELLTQLRILEQVGLRGHNAKLSDSSPAETERQFAKLKANYETLKRYDSSGYSGQDRLSYDVLEYFLGIQVRGEPWKYHNYPVNQMFGIQSALPNLLTETQQVNDATDAEHYLARMALFPKKMNEVIESLKVREAKKIIPPKFVVEKSAGQIKAFMEPAPAKNALVLGLKNKLDKIPAEKMDQASRDALLKRAEESVTANVLPAYTKLAKYLEVLGTKALENNGVWALPDGEKFYNYQIESMTTTKMKGDGIHSLGLSEVARIGADMDAILEAEGYKQATRAERLAALSKAPSQLYPNTDDGRAQILKDYTAIIDEINSKLDPLFGIKPKAKVSVERVPTFTEQGAPFAYYNPPAMDGSKPGIFYANLRRPDEIAKFTMRTLAYHEAIPGHHLQIAIAQELKGLPIFRNVVPFTAYAEGWALYAEQLAWENGLQKNPLDNLGRLQAEMFRAVRLVVDTGIHAKRWTREQAIEYMIANTGMLEDEVIGEIERYFVAPGQALAYKIGMIKILALREKAKAALGQNFDLRDFHDTVLKNGSLPLEILERVVDNYISEKKT
ncbi:MAG: DUF885 domain-containing protein [Aeromicrobium sp.]|nr:DUF885 domain-containing protein [Burkholderiales bacterium]